MYINHDTLMSVICEDERLDFSKDADSISNKFTTRPQGILIQDSYNNPFFPIQPLPKIDTSKSEIVEVFKRFRELYGRSRSLLLPWHFCIEMIEGYYVVLNTRPIDMRFPLNSYEARGSVQRKNWDSVTELFFKENIFDIDDAIHVCIIGDTNRDIYTNKTYQAIGRFCLQPLRTFFTLPTSLFQRIFGLNLGHKFDIMRISKFVS